MKKATVLFVPLLALALLASCGGGHEPDYTPAVYAQDVVTTYTPINGNEQITSLNLHVDINFHQLSKHEPTSGAFLGAYIVRDITAGSIRAFETYTNVSHAIFAYTMALDDAYPLLWVLENIASNKAPLITLLPPAYGTVFCVERLTKFAINTGRFNVPFFVNLYPLEGNHGFLPSEYIAFFRQAGEIFARYAPNVALVWGFDAQNLALSTQFYPGCVDWIKLKIYNTVDTNGNFRDFFAYVNLFYFTFQREAPLMISTAVSHYTTENNSYFTRQAADKITYIYTRLQNFPRVKAIIYRNYNDLHSKGHKFSINSAENIRAAYEQAALHPHFLSFVENIQEPVKTSVRIHSPFRAIMRYDFFYIPLKALIYDVRLHDLYRLDGLEVIINGDVFFTVADLNRKFETDFFVDLDRNVLVLR